MFLHFWVSVALTAPGAMVVALSIVLFMESHSSESEEMSVVVVSPAGLPPGMYKDALLAGTSLVCLLADPGPGFLFHYWA